ncbi:MAG TPA: hypothetical protein VF363_05815 [Candidatus Eisenbacteria bacterium]
MARKFLAGLPISMALVALVLSGADATRCMAQPSANLTGKKLALARDVHSGFESALGSLIAGTMKGDVTQVVVTSDETDRLVVRVTYTGFDGGKLWVEGAGSDRKAQRLVKGSDPAVLTGESGDVDLSLSLDPNAPENTTVKSVYLRVCVAKADRTTASFVKTFELGRVWQKGLRPENVVLTVAPRAIGETAKLGPTPTYVLPPKAIHPELIRASTTLTPIRSMTLPPGGGSAAPAPSSPATPPPAAPATRSIAGMRMIAAPMMVQNPAIATKTDPAAKLLPQNVAIASISRFNFGVPQEDKNKGAKGPAANPVEPLAELRSEDIELDPSHVLGVFPGFYPDQNAASGIFYFLPYSYSLRWDEDGGYELHMIYSASSTEGQAGEVAMAARLDAGLGLRERQIASDLIAAYAKNHGLAFTSLRALPIDSLSVSFSDDLRRYNIPADKIAVTGLSDFLGQIDVSWLTDPVTKENLQQALVEDVGISGRVKFYPSGGALAPIEVPIQIRLADYTTFGGFRWTRTGPWKNATPYPIKLKYLNALVLDPSSRPVVYSWDLAGTRVPPEARVNWQAGGVPGWIDSQAKRIWLDYSVESGCQPCDDGVIRSITGGVSATGPTYITFHTITPLADAGAHEIAAQVRSRYFDPQSHDAMTKVVVLSGDGKDFTVGPVFLGSRQPGETVTGDPLYEYFLEVTMADGTTYKATHWVAGDDLRLSIGRHQLEEALGSLPGTH